MSKTSKRFDELHNRLNELVDAIDLLRFDEASSLVSQIIKAIKPKSWNEKQKDDGFPLLVGRFRRHWKNVKRISTARIYRTPLKKSQQEKLVDVVLELVRFRFDSDDDAELHKMYAPALRRACLMYLKSTRSRKASQSTVLKPIWDRDAKTLTYAGEIVKRFRHTSKNQMPVLDAFEKQRWPPTIVDPLPPGNKDPKERVRQTVKRLNQYHNSTVIKFTTDGAGTGFAWRRTG